MRKQRPLLSIGLPVYNGSRYIREALDSILSQSFSDFELIISDNASTDGTDKICRVYEEMDRRIRFYRNRRNLGAARNFNIVLNLARGKYFKWIANDDVYAPEYLAKCVGVLEREPSVVLSYPRTKRIDEYGNEIGNYELFLDAGSVDPVERFRALTLADHACFQIFAVMRKDVLDRTNRFGNYSGADRVLISELSLYGRFHEVPEHLFLRRSHPHESRMLFPDRNLRIAWFDPAKAGKIAFSEWRILREYCRSISRAPVSTADKVRCYFIIGVLFKRNLRPLGHDLKAALRQALHLKPDSKHSGLT